MMKIKPLLKILSILVAVLMALPMLLSCEEEIDRSPLESALSLSIDEALYTSDSYELYKAAYEKALSIYNDKNASETQITAACDRLNEAVDGLVRRADFTTLQQLLSQSFLAENYTTESYTAYQQAFDKAQNISQNLDSKQAIVNSAAEVLKAAIEALVEKADASKLGSLLTTYIQPGDYTTLTYTRYQKIYDEAKDLYDQRTAQMSQAEADDFAQNIAICTKELETAIAGLQKRGDLTTLQKRYDELLLKYSAASDATGGKEPTEYFTEKSYENLGQALNEASTVLSSGDYSDYEIEQFLKNLEKANEELVVRSDTAELEELIITATNFYLRDPEIYSTDSYIALNNAVNRAKDLLTKENPPQADIDSAEQSILTAITGLEIINVNPGGSTEYRFDALILAFSTERTTIGEYMRNNATFLAAVGGLVSDYITPASTSDFLKLMIGNGMEVTFDYGSIHICLQNGVKFPSSGMEIASVAGVTLGMTPVEISNILGGAPTISNENSSGIRLLYVDGESGYELAITLDATSNTAISIECYFGE